MTTMHETAHWQTESFTLIRRQTREKL